MVNSFAPRLPYPRANRLACPRLVVWCPHSDSADQSADHRIRCPVHACAERPPQLALVPRRRPLPGQSPRAAPANAIASPAQPSEPRYAAGRSPHASRRAGRRPGRHRRRLPRISGCRSSIHRNEAIFVSYCATRTASAPHRTRTSGSSTCTIGRRRAARSSRSQSSFWLPGASSATRPSARRAAPCAEHERRGVQHRHPAAGQVGDGDPCPARPGAGLTWPPVVDLDGARHHLRLRVPRAAPPPAGGACPAPGVIVVAERHEVGAQDRRCRCCGRRRGRACAGWAVTSTGRIAGAWPATSSGSRGRRPRPPAAARRSPGRGSSRARGASAPAGCAWAAPRRPTAEAAVPRQRLPASDGFSHDGRLRYP